MINLYFCNLILSEKINQFDFQVSCIFFLMAEKNVLVEMNFCKKMVNDLGSVKYCVKMWENVFIESSYL